LWYVCKKSIWIKNPYTFIFYLNIHFSLFPLIYHHDILIKYRNAPSIFRFL
jgi:hypothetical protein